MVKPSSETLSDAADSVRPKHCELSDNANAAYEEHNGLWGEYARDCQDPSREPEHSRCQ
jgi:hypothetical protein